MYESMIDIACYSGRHSAQSAYQWQRMVVRVTLRVCVAGMNGEILVKYTFPQLTQATIHQNSTEWDRFFGGNICVGYMGYVRVYAGQHPM